MMKAAITQHGSRLSSDCRGGNKIQPNPLKSIDTVGLPHLWLAVLLITWNCVSLYRRTITLSLIWHKALRLNHHHGCSTRARPPHCLFCGGHRAPADRTCHSCPPFSSSPARSQSSQTPGLPLRGRLPSACHAHPRFPSAGGGSLLPPTPVKVAHVRK